MGDDRDRRVFCEGLPHHIDNLYDLIVAREADLDRLRSENDAIEGDIQRLLAERQRMLEEIRRLSARAHDRSVATTQIANLRASIHRLESQMRGLVAKFERNAGKIDSLVREIDRLRRELRQAHEEGARRCGLLDPNALPSQRPGPRFGPPGK